jgi:hypothetical protein
VAAKKGPTKVELEALAREEMVLRVRASVASGRGKSMFDGEVRNFGPMCRCGIRRKPSGISKHVADDGLCIVHPDKPPEPYVPGAGGKP